MSATVLAADLREPTSQAPEPGSIILSVRDLHTSFNTEHGLIRAVDGVSFDLLAGETFGIVGESGSGKSVTCRSLIGLLPTPPASTRGQVLYNGRNLIGLSTRQMQMVRGAHISMVFQDPMTFLNPLMRVGDQIAESLQAHTSMGKRERRMAALRLMREVGIPIPERRINDYPHQFSGGMRQRVLIAIALACRPRILLADEPTTALDVTIQDQILSLLLNLQREFGMTVVLVSHDLGVIAETCDRMAVMYGGQIVEQGDTVTLLTQPKHPYTQGLLRSLPGASTGKYLTPIPGSPPSLIDPPSGCRFLDRCPLAMEQCQTWHTELLPVGPNHLSRCIRHDQMDSTHD